MASASSEPHRAAGRSAWLRAHVPALTWVPRSRPTLTRDVVAGVTLWGLIVPEGMAYAGLAGLPPQAGLYTVLVSLVLYAALGTSRHMVVAATSASAALTGSVIATLHPPDAGAYSAYASALVLLVGVLFLLAGLLRLGFVAQFLSRPVMEGFIVGLAFFVAVGQLHKIFGVKKGDGNTPQKLWHVLSDVGSTNVWTLSVGVGCLLLLVGLPRLSKRVPAGLVVLALAIGLSSLLDLKGRHNVEVVGRIPHGLPGLSVPQIHAADLWTLLPAAAGIVLLAYSEGLAIAESFARRYGYEIDPNQELLAIGTANLASGSVGGLVACGGMSGSAVNDGAGARTQLSGTTAALLALVTVLALTPLFTNLPEAALGALIIHAVIHLMRPTKILAVRHVAPTEFLLALTALFGVLFLDVLEGLVIATLVSLLLVIYRSSRASVVALGTSASGGADWVALTRHAEAAPLPGVLVLSLDAPMYYANASANRDEIKRLVGAAVTPIQAVVLDPEVQHDLDVTSAETLIEIVEWLSARGIEVIVVATHVDLVAQAERAGVLDVLGRDHLEPTLAAAVSRAVIVASPATPPQPGRP